MVPELPDGFTARRPTLDDAHLVYDLMVACDIAEYGEADSDMNDLLAEWGEIELERDGWLVFAPDGRLTGYADVQDRSRNIFFLDWRTDPATEMDAVDVFLLAMGEARVRERSMGRDVQIATISPSVNEREHRLLEAAEYRSGKHYFRMLIEMKERPPAPIWPAGLALRNFVPGKDDLAVYEFIMTAFDWPGRESSVTFDQWRNHMMRPDHFIPELLFLLYEGETLIGAALCNDYVDYGWVRQLAVRKDWRGRGLGAALLQHVFVVFYALGRSQVALGVEANNVHARAFYERVGMTAVRQYDEYRKAI
jgi:ribosomal protein S18 acetylase RimI-like enzyme